MSYYIRGVEGRGPEVIKALEDKGGKNVDNVIGESKHVLYYIGKANRICSLYDSFESAYIITKYLTELTLPEKKEWKPKFKIGDYVRLDDDSPCIITAYPDNKLGVYHLKCCENNSHTSALEGRLTPWKPERGEPVLVRDSTSGMWKEAIYSFKSNLQGYIQHYAVGGTYWSYCIPFDENKLGKVTD